MRAAFFLDRDGTINFDHVYIKDPNLIELIPRSAEAIRRIHEAGFVVVVISNQSGVGRGIIPAEVLPQLNQRLDQLLAAEGAKVDLYKACLHTPVDHCDCRKPKPKMIFDAAEELGLDLTRSVFVGDMLTDIATGKNAQLKYSVLVRTCKASERERTLALAMELPESERPDHVANDLFGAVTWLLKELSEA